MRLQVAVILVLALCSAKSASGAEPIRVTDFACGAGEVVTFQDGRWACRAGRSPMGAVLVDGTGVPVAPIIAIDTRSVTVMLPVRDDDGVHRQVRLRATPRGFEWFDDDDGLMVFSGSDCSGIAGVRSAWFTFRSSRDTLFAAMRDVGFIARWNTGTTDLYLRVRKAVPITVMAAAEIGDSGPALWTRCRSNAEPYPIEIAPFELAIPDIHSRFVLPFNVRFNAEFAPP